MKMNGARCNRETEADTFLRRGMALHTNKGLKDRLELLVGHTRSTVFDCDCDFSGSFLKTELHAHHRSCIREPNRVANYVFTGTPKRFRIG